MTPAPVPRELGRASPPLTSTGTIHEVPQAEKSRPESQEQENAPHRVELREVDQDELGGHQPQGSQTGDLEPLGSVPCGRQECRRAL